MSVIGKIKGWFQGVGEAKDKQIHQAHKGDQPPVKKPGGIGSTPDKLEDAQKSDQQDWKGDT